MTCTLQTGQPRIRKQNYKTGRMRCKPIGSLTHLLMPKVVVLLADLTILPCPFPFYFYLIILNDENMHARMPVNRIYLDGGLYDAKLYECVLLGTKINNGKG